MERDIQIMPLVYLSLHLNEGAQEGSGSLQDRTAERERVRGRERGGGRKEEGVEECRKSKGCFDWQCCNGGVRTSESVIIIS